MPPEDKILLGQFGAAHGIRGEVKLMAFTQEPASVTAYGPLTLDDGRIVEILALRPQGEALVARVKGVGDRNAAETLRNRRLYVERSALPAVEDEDEFYQADLVGLAAEREDGTPLGCVVAVPDFGAGDLLEIQPEGGRSFYLPFTRAVVPIVDIAAGRVVVVPPPETEARGEDEAGDGTQDGGG